MLRVTWVPTELKVVMGEVNVVAAVAAASRLAPNVNAVVACGEDCTPARSISSTLVETTPLVISWPCKISTGESSNMY